VTKRGEIDASVLKDIQQCGSGFAFLPDAIDQDGDFSSRFPAWTGFGSKSQHNFQFIKTGAVSAPKAASSSTFDIFRNEKVNR
jgi:hypothetical protein